jgi:predicted MFS family arabinose efflux permease
MPGKMADQKKAWDTSYEWKVVTLLGLGFGLVGLDRWIIAPMAPSIIKDLHLSIQDFGNIIGILGVCWGVFAIVMGGVSDKIGYRKVLIPAIVLFSLLSGLSGYAVGFMSLLLIRSVMGFTEGSFCPTSFAATADASEPKRRGLNQGLQQSTFALFGLGFGPIIATQLLQVVPSWRWVFFIVAIPGFILAILMFFVIRDPAHVTAPQQNTQPKGRWVEIFKSRNIVLCMAALLCAMTGVFVLGAMLPNYLTDYLHLTVQQEGFVMSGLGFGGFFGQFGIPGLSDIFGRRLMAVASFIGAAIMLRIFITVTGQSMVPLFVLMFVVSFFCLGLIALITGPIATESAPLGLVSSAIGIVVGVGEIFGGGVAPALAGTIAKNYGIQSILYLALTGIGLGVIVCLFLKETAPRKIRAQA